jgi:hypothetical protein
MRGSNTVLWNNEAMHAGYAQICQTQEAIRVRHFPRLRSVQGVIDPGFFSYFRTCPLQQNANLMIDVFQHSMRPRRTLISAI